jgi:transcriptional antiterminator RfaH
MPILAAEAALFPEGLFAEPRPPEAEGRLWWVLHTRPRQEKGLARTLYDKRVPFFLPQAPRRLFVRGRPTTSHLPLFPGYLFLLAGGDERGAALATGRVVRPLPVADQARLWHDLGQTHRLLASGLPTALETRLTPGAVVEVRGGPLAGLRGTILRAASGRRFVVRIDFIQQGASVLLDDWVLVRAADARPA